MKPLTEQHLALLRRHMVEIVDMHFDLAEDEIGKAEPGPQLRRALMDVPRHLFVPEPLMLMSYQDTPLPIGFDKTISQPFIGALMIDLLGVEPRQPRARGRHRPRLPGGADCRNGRRGVQR